MELNKRNLGTALEDIAADYVNENGAKVVERNFRCKSGEIDIIARDGKYLCFIEVKYRKSVKYGSPETAVDYLKRKKISKASGFYMYYKHLDENTPVRYDVIAISGDDKEYKIKWIKDAFEYVY
ncbi:YraN family protein [Butyrivibrio sp. X503]|uniref:YraN family protein n=1 Tax=Butyrivibrio sp. X503 TaxID=2364878 RepID=UPI000EA976C0|nr:YraN family protein [Butyrivibrio sp. X503]RKM57092.1 YraN family protein [Butyrivibrio sp. X503]